MRGTLQPEDRISHYRIVAPLGAGGMGEVYVAQDERLDRSVALKTLPPHLVRNEERLRRFITEARSASSLNHPNIVTIYEIGHDEVRPPGAGAAGSSQNSGEAGPGTVHFIAMELVSGDTLMQKIHAEKADLRTLLGCIAQAAEGIAKAHAAGIVHRDLKPGNIMVSRDGFTKVLDFGLAKLTEKPPAQGGQATNAPTEAVATSEGTLMGTVGYMSPEQVQGKAADHRSDIFSMGCVLYEAATRRRPFVAETDVEVMHQILRDPPAPVEELNPGIPSEVRRVIRRCLAKNREERFQSMRDLAIELREIVAEYDTLAPATPSAAMQISRPLAGSPPRRKGLVAGIAAIALVGLAGLAVWLYGVMSGSGSRATPDAGLQQMKISVLMSGNNLAEAVLSADGRYLAFVTNDAGKSSLNVRQVRTGSDVQILSPQEFRIRGISFSPDGDYLFFRNQDLQSPNYHALYQVPSLGGTPRKVIFDVDTAAAFSPDGRRICFRRGFPQEQADTLVIASLETGEQRELIRLKPPEAFNLAGPDGSFSPPPAWSPDGKSLAAAIFSAAGGVRGRVVVIDAETGARQELGSQNWVLVNSVGWLSDGSAILASAFVIGTSGFQIYRIGYPDGEVLRMTNDLTGYSDLSVSSDGRAIAAMQRTDITNIHVAPLEGGAPPRPITFATGDASSVDLIAQLDDGGVAFTAPQGGRMFVWRVEADGSARRQLTASGVYVLNLLSAGQAGIVFTQIEENGASHVWRMGADGGGLRQLTDGPGEDLLAVSPDGKTALFVKWANRFQLWKQSLEGGEASLLHPVYGGGVLLFSPDGRRLLYSNYEQAEGRMYPRQFVIPAAGGEPLATFVCPPGSMDLQWRPDGEAVTYIDRDTGFNLMLHELAGGPPVPLTRFAGGRLASHAWAPDGSQIALHRRSGQQEGIWILRPGSADPRMLAEYRSGTISALRWAADSKRLDFTYGTSNQDVVLISDFR